MAKGVPAMGYCPSACPSADLWGARSIFYQLLIICGSCDVILARIIRVIVTITVSLFNKMA